MLWSDVSHWVALIDKNVFRKVELHCMWHFSDGHPGLLSSKYRKRKTIAGKAFNDTQSGSKRVHFQHLLANSLCRARRNLRSVGEGEWNMPKPVKLCFYLFVVFLWLVDLQGVSAAARSMLSSAVWFSTSILGAFYQVIVKGDAQSWQLGKGRAEQTSVTLACFMNDTLKHSHQK